MRVRPRLAFTTLSVTLPMLVGLIVFQQTAQDRAAESWALEFAQMYMNTERTECEASPATWTAESSRLPYQYTTDLYAYDEQFRGQHPQAPALRPHLIEQLSAGNKAAIDRYEMNGHPVHDYLVRMSWNEGPCSVILVRKSYSGPIRTLLSRLIFWREPALVAVPVLIAALGAMMAALSPLIRRVGQLATAVENAHNPASSLNALADIAAEGNDEIADLARAFERSSLEVSKQVEAKEQREATLRGFIENTTHDVMIPLSVLQGHLSELRAQNTADPLLLGQAINETHYIASLIRNLELGAKLESGNLQQNPVNLTEAVGRVAARHRMLAQEKAVTLYSAVPEAACLTQGDVTMIEQAIGNVVENAIRYNRREGQVAITLDQQRDGRFAIRVIDDGPGISEDDLSRLSQRYYRGDAARTRTGGKGLGLNIAQQVASAHDWKMTLTRSEYGGLLVEFIGVSSEAVVSG